MPIHHVVDVRTGQVRKVEVPLTPEQIAQGEEAKARRDARQERADARAAAVAVLEQRGSGPPTREEFDALKDAVRELLA